MNQREACSALFWMLFGMAIAKDASAFLWACGLTIKTVISKRRDGYAADAPAVADCDVSKGTQSIIPPVSELKMKLTPPD